MTEHHLAIDGKRHDNPKHAGQHSHQKRIAEAEFQIEELNASFELIDGNKKISR